MNKMQRVKIIESTLNELYPKPNVPLNHINPFTLLVAVILSAQSTDKKVNELTHSLFKKASNPEDMYSIGIKGIYNEIKYLGLSNQKSKNIHRTSQILIEKFNSQVPKSFLELESLPGVGHKTASVVMSQAFGIPTFPVDTHIHRLSQRWGLTKGKNVITTERDLKAIFPKEKWNTLHLQIIFFGREYCTARGCDGSKCFLCKKLYPKRKTPFKHLKA